MLMQGKICLVTGASRGVGKGIALALGAQGATVYVSGRSLDSATESALGGTLNETAAEITARGGCGIAVPCDHGDDASIQRLFEQIQHEQGRLDLLVNNAIALPASLTAVAPFWQKPLDELSLLDVGLRSGYVAAWHAAPLLIASRGLIAFTASFGGTCYMHGPAYGAGKAGTDKMAHDMAHDLKPHDVAVVSLWLGLVKTERTNQVCGAKPEKYGAAYKVAESPEFPGRVIAALYNDPARLSHSGTIQVVAELAKHYGVTDLNDRQPPSYRKALGPPTVFSTAVVE
ncbi:MAG: SDR family NAD(P)-dependent oxidoreductase [Sterolibacterium sp.]|jgi:NAD(P)-dependent dehydrogenase (short-subunit alcohol dehydrogenase family)|nr:SDR family NAD(P)-dependent oxidoreductase [Sterolibacterium sp.]